MVRKNYTSYLRTKAKAKREIAENLKEVKQVEDDFKLFLENWLVGQGFTKDSFTVLIKGNYFEVRHPQHKAAAYKYEVKQKLYRYVFNGVKCVETDTYFIRQNVDNCERMNKPELNRFALLQKTIFAEMTKGDNGAVAPKITDYFNLINQKHNYRKLIEYHTK